MFVCPSSLLASVRFAWRLLLVLVTRKTSCPYTVSYPRTNFTATTTTTAAAAAATVICRPTTVLPLCYVFTVTLNLSDRRADSTKSTSEVRS